MTFSILSWNIWYRNQMEGDPRYDRLPAELKRLIDRHQPDLIALNEVVWPADEQHAPVITYLKTLGYDYSYCANKAAPGMYWPSSVALCSRFEISREQKFVISKNGYMEKRGYPGFNKEAISVQVALSKEQSLTMLVAHPQDTYHALKDHRVGMDNLDRLVHSEAYAKNTILVGDMNEWRLIPRAFRRKVADIMDSRTGTLLHPTWRFDGHRSAPLRLNLDYVYWNKQSDFTLKDFKVLASDVSDHRPFLATFELA